MDYELYKNISKRMVAVFIAQALSVIGAGSLVGIDVYKSAILAGFLGVANVLEILARKYLEDGKLTWEEVNQAFNIVSHND